MALKLTGTTSTSSYTLLIVLRSLWGVSMWKATWDMSATAALVEQVQLCRETYGTSYFLLYMLFINYCLYTVLQLWSSWNRNFPVLLFLYRCLTMVGSDLRLVTWCLCRSTPFPWRWKDTYSWVLSNNEGPSMLENMTEDYVPAFPWL